MSTFVKRTITATVFAIVMLGGMLWNLGSFTLLFFVINAGALWEYYKLAGKMYSPEKINHNIYRYTGITLGSIIYIGFHLLAHHGVSNSYSVVLILLPLFIFFILELYSRSEQGIINSGLNILGIFYITVPLGLLQNLIAHGNPFENWFPGKVWLILGILLLIWTNDTFAYIGGSLLGKHKLFPSISPGKTWEGFFIGIIGSIGIGIILSLYFTGMGMRDWVIVAVIVSVTGTLGDLFESMLKRNAGVKDSGSIMPGHGGFLDRFDAFIFCIPFVYAYVSLFIVNF